MSNDPAPMNHDAHGLGSDDVEHAACGAEEGAANGCAVAARTWKATGRFVSRFVYTTCYTISYGVVFSTTLLSQAIPTNNAAVRGLIDGAHAAVHQLDQLQAAALESPVASPSPALAPA